MTRIAVAILNYNGEHLLPQFLPSVVRCSGDADVVVIDNASTDGSLDWISREYPHVRIIRLSENLGYCGGYNTGLKEIDADVVVLLNSDVEVTADWLTAPVQLFDADPMLFAVQPKILRWKERNRFDYAGAGGGFIDALGYPYCRGRFLDQLEEDHGQYNDTCSVAWASGACMFVRKDVFHSLGGFETSFFAHMEEIDLCWRASRNGHRIRYCGASTVYHLGGGTLPVSSPKKTYLNFRNNLSLLFRNLPAGRLVWLLPVRFVLDLLASVSFLLRGQARSAVSVLRAHGQFMMCLPWEIERRSSVAGKGYALTGERGNVTSVIWQRYVAGRNT